MRVFVCLSLSLSLSLSGFVTFSLLFGACLSISSSSLLPLLLVAVAVDVCDDVDVHEERISHNFKCFSDFVYPNLHVHLRIRLCLFYIDNYSCMFNCYHGYGCFWARECANIVEALRRRILLKIARNFMNMSAQRNVFVFLSGSFFDDKSLWCRCLSKCSYAYTSSPLRRVSWLVIRPCKCTCRC